jgi:hypothetical protein
LCTKPWTSENSGNFLTALRISCLCQESNSGSETCILSLYRPNCNDVPPEICYGVIVFSVSIAPNVSATTLLYLTAGLFLVAEWLRPNVLTDDASEMNNCGYQPCAISRTLLRGAKVSVNWYVSCQIGPVATLDE